MRQVTVRICVLSDTHGHLAAARQAVQQVAPVDLVLHAGDHYRDALRLKNELGVPVAAVVGNCDFGEQGPLEETLELQGLKILLTHGHRYRAKEGLWLLWERGLELGAELVVFGHTHVATCREKQGICLFNPGSLSFPRDGSPGSFGLIEISESGFEANIVTLVGK